jgi:hypothetical protein
MESCRIWLVSGFIPCEMNTMDTRELLEAYSHERSEAAFQELVNRYVNLVFSMALRRVAGNRQLAWLHRHTGFVASNLLRGEQRRQNRERKALEMNLLNEPSDADWNQLAPALDETMDEQPPSIMSFGSEGALRAKSGEYLL